MNLEHERAWMKLSATPTGLIPEGSLAFPGFGNPGLEYAIPLGLTSTSGRWKQTTQSHGFNTAYRHVWRTLTLTLTTPSHGHRSVNSDSLIVSSPIEFQVRVSKPWVRGGQNLNPHFSSPVYYVAAIIRPGCVSLGRPPRRTVQVRLRRPRSQALPGRPLRRLATTGDEKCGLRVCAKITWHFGISDSRHLRPLLNREILNVGLATPAVSLNRSRPNLAQI